VCRRHVEARALILLSLASSGSTIGVGGKIMVFSFAAKNAPLKYSYMLGGMFSSCASAMCLRTISEYKKRSPQMRQCHWSRAKMYGRHSGFFGSSFGWGIFKCYATHRARLRDRDPYPAT